MDYKKFKFSIEIDGIVNTQFMSCEGLKETIGQITYRNGNDPDRFKKETGLSTFDNVVLTAGVTNDKSELDEWRKSKEPRNVSIIQNDNDGNEAIRWNLLNARPAGFSPFDTFGQDTEEIQIATLELSYEDFF